jgi:thiol-disulfide isomerase/thioredoxin
MTVASDKKKSSQPSKKSDRAPERSRGSPKKTRPDNKILLAVLLMAVVILGVVVVFGGQLTSTLPSVPTSPGKITVWYFYGNGCKPCESVTPYVQSLQRKYPDVEFHFLEIYDNPANRDTLIAMNKKHGQKDSGIPLAYVNDIMLFGGNEVPEKLESTILQQMH